MPRFGLFSLLFTCSKHLTRHDNDTFSMRHLSKQPPPTAVPLQLASQSVSEEASSEHVEEKAGSGAHTLKASFSHSALIRTCFREKLTKLPEGKFGEGPKVCLNVLLVCLWRRISHSPGWSQILYTTDKDGPTSSSRVLEMTIRAHHHV